MHGKQIRLIFRILGVLVFGSAGIAVSTFLHQFPNLPSSVHQFIMAFAGLSGALIGWFLTPRLVLRPFNRLRRLVEQVPASVIFSATVGLFIGLALGAIAAYPISYLPQPLGEFLPFIVAAAFGYVGLMIAIVRPELVQGVRDRFSSKEAAGAPVEPAAAQSPAGVLLDTSVIIDGRIADICRTGFIQGELIVPLFVLNELQHVADSADTLRRNRGRRGLEILRQLQEDSPIPVHLVDQDVPTVREVDDKLIALAKEMGAAILTNDYNLNRVAELQSVQVLNVNELANAVKTVLLPGETFTIHVLQEGKEYNQGVGYLDDGTMVVVEEGIGFIGSTIDVTVNKVLQTAAGRMIFARPNAD
ncbi:MAG: PIN domain-containing protein [Anaerolineae bacterium]|nr:PIN domain-containing protein [Anaerolineae bacterium]